MGHGRFTCMANVLGIGAVMFKSKDPEALGAWYGKMLGLPLRGEGFGLFRWRSHDEPGREHCSVWALFPEGAEKFGTSRSPFVINYIVDSLDEVLDRLRRAGAAVEEVEESEEGRFGWVYDPEGNRVELWEPAMK